MKKFFVFFISLVLVLMEINLIDLDVYAASYNPTTAATWAVQNYTNFSDSVICAEFASKCLQAGGCDIATHARVINLYTALCGRSEFTKYAMAKIGNSKELYSTGANAGKIAIGDILIFYTASYPSAPYMHAAIVTGISSQGIVSVTQRGKPRTGLTGLWGFYNDTGTVTTIYCFHYNGGSSTVTPTPTPDPITFQTPTYSNLTQTTAYVQVNVTADSSQLSEVGMKWYQVVGSTYYYQTDFSWAGSSVRSKISVDFGKEKDKKGNTPTLLPGSTYRCQFFAVTKAGKTIYSNLVEFTTKSIASTDTTPPVISNIQVETYRGGYNVCCDVYDNVGVTKVAFPTWTTKNDQDDLQNPWPVGSPWRQNANGTITYKMYINASDHNNEQGYYVTHIYAYDAAGNSSKAIVTPNTCVDWTIPIISDIKITDQTGTGYTVQCKVTDNVGISRVKFPTWTEKNGQDDILWGEGTKNGNVYSYRVNISDHNNEYGLYHSHIYAYDNAGNENSAAAQDYNMTAIVITKQPENLTGVIGETVTFRIDATGTGLKYEWQYKMAGSSGWVSWPGSGESQIWFPITGKHVDQIEFRCVITDRSNHTVISQIAKLSVLGSVDRYTVTFDSQGGSSVNAIKNIVENTKISCLPDPPVRNHFTFMGWYTEPNGQGQIVNENTVINGDMTVYAYWEMEIVSVPNGFWVNEVPAQQYTGKAIKPYIAVYDGKKILKEKVDYTLSYKNNMKANDASNNKTAPVVVVKGKGNYSGTEKVLFPILPRDIGAEDVTSDNLTRVYNNSVQKPVPTVTWNGKKLKYKTDFIVNYPDNSEGAYQAEGYYQIEIIGKGNFCGRRTVQLLITNKKLMSKVSIAKIPNQSYTGDIIRPEVIVKDGSTLLKENVDYFLLYQNNIETGTATVVLSGIGDYRGKKSATFKISGIDIKKANVTNIPKSVMYTGNSITITPHLTIVNNEGETKLEELRDYTVSYQRNKAVGTATVIFKGKKNYAGTLKKTFKITPYQIEQDIAEKIKVNDNITAEYAIGGSRPKMTVYFGTQMMEEGRDYTLKYSNNKNLSSMAMSDKLPTMTICGKGNFTGNLSIPFEIVPQEMGALRIETPDKVYQNKSGKCLSIPKITDLNGKILKAGRDYESAILYTYIGDVTLSDGVSKASGSQVEPTDIPPAGTWIMITVTGKGNYTGERHDFYRITQFDISRAKVSIPRQTYTGSEIYPDKDQIEVRIGATVLADTDYEIVDYSNNLKKGTATIVICGTGDYGGTKKATFKIGAKGFRWWWR